MLARLELTALPAILTAPRPLVLPSPPKQLRLGRRPPTLLLVSRPVTRQLPKVVLVLVGPLPMVMALVNPGLSRLLREPTLLHPLVP